MRASPLLPVHQAAGALLAQQAPDGPLEVLTYGDVPAEYRAAQEGSALFDQAARGLVVVSGPEAALFLHRLLSNSVRTLAPGQGNRNLLLSSKGKVQHDFDLELEPDQIRLSTLPGQDAALAAALEMYHFSEKVEIAARGEEHAPLALTGPRAGEILRSVLGVEPPKDDHAWIAVPFQGASVRITALPVAGSPGVRVDGGPAAVKPLWEALVRAGAQPCGLAVRDILRVEAGFAEPGVDIDDSIYPQEARLERAFSLDKGCYIGQEVVAKIDTYGGLNKRLVGLRVSHDNPIARGTRLLRDEDGEVRDLGVVTSWAYSFVLDTGLALAYVKRRHQAAGTRFRLGETGAEAEVVALPVRAGALALTGDNE